MPDKQTNIASEMTSAEIHEALDTTDEIEDPQDGEFQTFEDTPPFNQDGDPIWLDDQG